MRFQFSPNDFKAPELRKEMVIKYSWCKYRKIWDEDAKEFHNCTKGIPWPACEHRVELEAEWWSEWYVMSAGGVPVEKWRKVVLYETWGRPHTWSWTLLWRSPFSNSYVQDSPVTPMGGRLVREEAENPRGVSVPLKMNLFTGGWMFAAGPEKVNKVLHGLFDSEYENVVEYLDRMA